MCGGRLRVHPFWAALLVLSFLSPYVVHLDILPTGHLTSGLVHLDIVAVTSIWPMGRRAVRPSATSQIHPIRQRCIIVTLWIWSSWQQLRLLLLYFVYSWPPSPVTFFVGDTWRERKKSRLEAKLPSLNSVTLDCLDLHLVVTMIWKALDIVEQRVIAAVLDFAILVLSYLAIRRCNDLLDRFIHHLSWRMMVQW